MRHLSYDVRAEYAVEAMASNSCAVAQLDEGGSRADEVTGAVVPVRCVHCIGTTSGLIEGGELTFVSRGPVRLKGVAAERQVYAAT
jgi:hypothetical protein